MLEFLICYVGVGFAFLVFLLICCFKQGEGFWDNYPEFVAMVSVVVGWPMYILVGIAVLLYSWWS